MPVLVKSLQSVHFTASCVFGELEVSKTGIKQGMEKDNSGKKKKNEGNGDLISHIAKSLTEDVPEYSGQYIINDADDTEETRAMNGDLDFKRNDMKSIDLCAILKEMPVLASDNNGENGSSDVDKVERV